MPCWDFKYWVFDTICLEINFMSCIVVKLSLRVNKLKLAWQRSGYEFEMCSISVLNLDKPAASIFSCLKRKSWVNRCMSKKQLAYIFSMRVPVAQASDEQYKPVSHLLRLTTHDSSLLFLPSYFRTNIWTWTLSKIWRLRHGIYFTSYPIPIIVSKLDRHYAQITLRRSCLCFGTIRPYEGELRLDLVWWVVSTGNLTAHSLEFWKSLHSLKTRIPVFECVWPSIAALASNIRNGWTIIQQTVVPLAI